MSPIADGPRRVVRRRISTVALGVAVVLSLFSAGNLVGVTDAAWNDTEHRAASFAAATISAPWLTARCAYKSGILGIGARVEIYWAAPDGYDLSHAQLEVSTAGLGSGLEPLTGFNLAEATKGNATSGYTTTIHSNLLGGLLGLARELEVAIWMTRHGWDSEKAAVATNAGLVAGLGGACRNLTAIRD